MSKYKVAATFDIIKWDDDYTLEDYDIIYSFPDLDQAFLFHEDLLDGFLDMDEYENLKVNHAHRVFIVLGISPTYDSSWEGYGELDGWDWNVLALTSEDLGEVKDDLKDDSSIQS